MRTITNWCLMAGLTLAAMTGAHAAEEAVKEKGKKKAEPGAQIFNLPKEVELTAEQQEKVAALKKEFGAQAAEAQKKVDDVLTAEQKQARKAAADKAKADKLKGKDAQAAIEAAMKLSDEQKTKWTAAQAEFRELQGKVRAKMAEFLTDEQKAKVPGLAPKKSKKTK